MVGGLQMVVLGFEFHQNRLSGFGAVGGGVEICPSPLTWPLDYTTAGTTVQAATDHCDSKSHAVALLSALETNNVASHRSTISLSFPTVLSCVATVSYTHLTLPTILRV